MVVQQLPPPGVVSAANWPEVLRAVLWLLPELHETEESRSALAALQRSDYPDLSVAHKLALLTPLTERRLSLAKVVREARARRPFTGFGAWAGASLSRRSGRSSPTTSRAARS